MAGRKQGAPPEWGVVRGMLHKRLKDAAAELNVSITYLRRICRQNGYPSWPGKRIRYRNSIGRTLKLEVDPEGSSQVGLAGPSQVAKVAETKKEEVEDDEDEEEDMTGVPEPDVNPPPRGELVTLNLIDKVGLSSASSERS